MAKGAAYVALPNLNALNALSKEVIDELNEYEAFQVEHRKTCPCVASGQAIELVNEYKLAVSEMLVRCTKTSEKSLRQLEALNGDKTQLS